MAFCPAQSFYQRGGFPMFRGGEDFSFGSLLAHVSVKPFELLQFNPSRSLEACTFWLV